MGLRPARAIKNIAKVAWTRFSRRSPRRSFIKAMPHKDLNVFRMGQNRKEYDTVVHLEAIEDLILRDNSIESARQAANKYLEKLIMNNYYFIVRVFPHHVLRENKMIAGAGADRLQKGMRMSFGRPVDRGARIYGGVQVFTIHTYKMHLDKVKTAMEKAKRKLSGSYKIIVA